MLTTPEFLDPIEKPGRKTPLTVAESIQLKTSIIITKRKGDKGSSCPKSWELLKHQNEWPFTKTEKRIKEIQSAIQERYLSPKPHLFNK